MLWAKLFSCGVPAFLSSCSEMLKWWHKQSSCLSITLPSTPLITQEPGTTLDQKIDEADASAVSFGHQHWCMLMSIITISFPDGSSLHYGNCELLTSYLSLLQKDCQRPPPSLTLKELSMLTRFSINDSVFLFMSVFVLQADLITFHLKAKIREVPGTQVPSLEE